MSKFLFLLTSDIPTPGIKEEVEACKMFNENTFFYIDTDINNPRRIPISLNKLFKIWQFHHENSHIYKISKKAYNTNLGEIRKLIGIEQANDLFVEVKLFLLLILLVVMVVLPQKS